MFCNHCEKDINQKILYDCTSESILCIMHEDNNIPTEQLNKTLRSTGGDKTLMLSNLAVIVPYCGSCEMPDFLSPCRTVVKNRFTKTGALQSYIKR